MAIERRTYTLDRDEIAVLIATEMTRRFGQEVKAVNVSFSISESRDYAPKLNCAQATVEIKDQA